MKITLNMFSLLFSVLISISATASAGEKNGSNVYVILQQNDSEFTKIKDSFAENSTYMFINSFLNLDKISQEVSDQGFEMLNAYVDSSSAADVFEYLDKNSNISAPIVRYIDPQDDLEEPIWKTVNHKLNYNLKLNEDENNFATKLNNSLSNLPKIEGISFRGEIMKNEKLKGYFKGAVINVKGFFSTTLDPVIANGFATSSRPGEPPSKDLWSVIFIINGKSGRYISLFVPTNMHEVEILFPTATNFEVKRVVKDEKEKTATVWLSEK